MLGYVQCLEFPVTIASYNDFKTFPTLLAVNHCPLCFMISMFQLLFLLQCDILLSLFFDFIPLNIRL